MEMKNNMSKNVKRIFFVLTLLTLLVAISAVSASDVSAVNATDDTDNSIDNTVNTIDNTISEKTSTPTSKVVKEETTTKTSTEDKKVKEKEIVKDNKTNKNSKKSITIDGITYNNVIENQVISDDDWPEITENTFYNHCTFTNTDSGIDNYATIYINNSEAKGESYQYSFQLLNNEPPSKMIINNSKVYQLYNGGDLFIYNSTLNDALTTFGDSVIVIDELTTLGPDFNVIILTWTETRGLIYTNNTQIISKLEELNIPGITIISDDSNDDNIIIENQTITDANTNSKNLTYINCILNSKILNYGSLTLINSTLNSTIENQGTLIIDDNCVLGENLVLENKGEIVCNNSTSLIPYSTIINGNYALENIILNSNKTNNGNLTLINCNITAKITNNGNLTLINCSLSNNNMTMQVSEIGAFLLDNYGQLNLVNCSMVNNTFNGSGRIGAVLNRNDAVLNLNNSLFKDNTDGFYLILDFGVINDWNNCSFINNSMTSYINNEYLSYIPDSYTLNVYDSLFENNSVQVFNARNMSVFNSKFNNNKHVKLDQGGAGFASSDPMGIAITANTLNVDNCTFDGNGIISKDQYTNTGGYGGAILATNLKVNNSVFRNNILNTTTTWTPDSGTGAAIRITTQDGTSLANCEVYNSIFENNYVSNPSVKNLPTLRPGQSGNTGEGSLPGSGADIYSIGNLIVVNNTFTSSYASNQASSIYAYVRSYQIQQNNITITDNTFNKCKSSQDTIVIEQHDLDDIVTLENNIYTNTTINDELVLDIPSKIYAGEPITITGTYNILNTSFYDADILDQNKFNVYINGKLNQTLDTIEFTITPTDGNMIITVQPTISQTRKTESIRSTTLTNITITPENYDEYVFEGILVGIAKDTKITFQGEFTNKELCVDINDIIMDGSKATFTNTIFILEGSGITFTNMTINNTNTDYPVKNTADNNTITYNKISITNNDGKTAAIYNKANNTEMTYNTIYVDGPALSTDFSLGLGIANTQGILLIGGDKNKVEYNTITTTSSGISSIFGTIEAITNSMQATNTQIQYNNITVNGNAKFNYGINGLGDVKNATISNNNLLITGERYTGGIQVGDGAENCIIQNNNIKCVCQNTTPVDEEAITYGIITINSNVGYATPENITIEENTIDLTGSVNYGMEIYRTKNSQIYNNVITVNGLQSMGIGLAHSPTSYIMGNNITTNGDSSAPLNGVTEEIQPNNAGIQIQQESTDVYVAYNNIQTYDKAGQDACVNVDSNNAYIMFNNLTSSTGYGAETIKTTQTDTTIQNNTLETTITIEDVTGLKNTPTTLTAIVTYVFENPINCGIVTFTDADGNTIATAEVVDGTATTTAIFKQTGESTITATYNPTSTELSSSTTEATLTVKDKFQTTITIDEVKPTAGETITITAHILDENGETVNGGKVTFKVNGKTVKDANGKVVYAKVVDGVATVEYTVPDNMAAQEVTITATYTGTSKFNKETATLTTTVTAPEATLTITPINDDVQTGSTVTLKAKVAAGDKAITTGKVVFKVNGKTVKDENGKVIYAKVDSNGEVSVDYTIPESFKAGTYNIEAVFTASGYEKLTDNTTMTVVKS
jgi:hypothetical protein